MSDYRLAIDTGGTFIDFVLLDERSGEVSVEKEDSTEGKIAEQLVKGAQRFGVPFDEIARLFHGTTVGINALIQMRGARVGLITTAGFRDVLEVGRGGRSPVYNFLQTHPAPIVERHLRREVVERVNAAGSMQEPVRLDQLDQEIEYLIAAGVDSLAIAFLHAYANPVNERLAAARVRQRYPHLPVSVSHEIAAEWREYERTSTTVLNAFLQPSVAKYLEKVQRQLRSLGYQQPLAVMQSSGGIADADASSAKPIRTLMSGPAGGVLGAKFLCDRLGYSDVICTDVGGTTYDIALIEDGRILERHRTEIGGRAVLGSMIDVTSIGAGGGSIAWLDHRGALQVGPQSAGSTPGPACFGRGGVEPTTTDAHLLLGRLDPEYFLGGRMRLDFDLAMTAVLERIAKPLGLDPYAAAEGILAIAESNMANAIRKVTIGRGRDPREFVVLAYGGGGGLFACAVADELGVCRVIVPTSPANFSAWGILTSDYVEDAVRTNVMPFESATLPKALETLDTLQQAAIAAIEKYGFERSRIVVERRLDLRFRHQAFTISVDLEREWTDLEVLLHGARDRFVATHRRLYSHGDPSAAIELVSARVRAIGPVKPPGLMTRPLDTGTVPDSERLVRFPGAADPIPTRVVDRDSLAVDRPLRGPAIINEWTTTTILPPHWICGRDEFGNLVLESTSGQGSGS